MTQTEFELSLNKLLNDDKDNTFKAFSAITQKQYVESRHQVQSFNATFSDGYTFNYDSEWGQSKVLAQFLKIRCTTNVFDREYILRLDVHLVNFDLVDSGFSNITLSSYMPETTKQIVALCIQFAISNNILSKHQYPNVDFNKLPVDILKFAYENTQDPKYLPQDIIDIFVL